MHSQCPQQPQALTAEPSGSRGARMAAHRVCLSGGLGRGVHLCLGPGDRDVCR